MSRVSKLRQRYVVLEPHPFDGKPPTWMSNAGHQANFRSIVRELSLKPLDRPSICGPSEEGFYTVAYVDEDRNFLRTRLRSGLYQPGKFLPPKLYRTLLDEMPLTLVPATHDQPCDIAFVPPWDDLFDGMSPGELFVGIRMIRNTATRDSIEALAIARDKVAFLTREGTIPSEWPYWISIRAHRKDEGMLRRATGQLRISAPTVQQLKEATPFLKRIEKPTPVIFCLSWLGYMWHDFLLDLEGPYSFRRCRNPQCDRIFVATDPRMLYCGAVNCDRQRTVDRVRHSRRRRQASG